MPKTGLDDQNYKTEGSSPHGPPATLVPHDHFTITHPSSRHPPKRRGRDYGGFRKASQFCTPLTIIEHLLRWID